VGKATIEDLMTRETYLSALVGAGYSVKLNAAERAADTTVEAATSAFKRLGLGEFNHIPKTKAARWLTDKWLEKPDAVDQKALDNAAALFKALNARLAATG
jgi:hypothetical protein